MATSDSPVNGSSLSVETNAMGASSNNVEAGSKTDEVSQAGEPNQSAAAPRNTETDAMEQNTESPSPMKALEAVSSGLIGPKGKNSLRVSYTPLSKSTYTSTARRSTQNSVYAPGQPLPPDRPGLPHSHSNPDPIQREPSVNDHTREGDADKKQGASSKGSASKPTSSEPPAIIGLPPRKPIHGPTRKTSLAKTAGTSPQGRYPSGLSPPRAPKADSRTLPSSSSDVDKNGKRPTSPSGGQAKRVKFSPAPVDADEIPLDLSNYPPIRPDFDEFSHHLPPSGSVRKLPFKKQAGIITCMVPACNKQQFKSDSAYLQHAKYKAHQFRLMGPRLEKERQTKTRETSSDHEGRDDGLPASASASIVDEDAWIPSWDVPDEPVIPAHSLDSSTLKQGLANRPLPSPTTFEPVPTTTSTVSVDDLTADQLSRLETLWNVHHRFKHMRRLKPDPAVWEGVSQIPVDAIKAFLDMKDSLSESARSSPVDEDDAQIPGASNPVHEAQKNTNPAELVQNSTPSGQQSDSLRSKATFAKPQSVATSKAEDEHRVSEESSTPRALQPASAKQSAPEPSSTSVSTTPGSAQVSLSKSAAQKLLGRLASSAKIPISSPIPLGSTEDESKHVNGPKTTEMPKIASKPIEKTKTEPEYDGPAETPADTARGQTTINYPVMQHATSTKPLKRPRWEYVLVDPNAKEETEEVEITLGKTRLQERVLREGSDESYRTGQQKRSVRKSSRTSMASIHADDVSSDEVPWSRLAQRKSSASRSVSKSFASSDSESDDSKHAGSKAKIRKSEHRKASPQTQKKVTKRELSGTPRPSMPVRASEAPTGPTTSMMSRLEAHVMLGKPINIDNWYHAKLGSRDDIRKFLGKIASILPKDVLPSDQPKADSTNSGDHGLAASNGIRGVPASNATAAGTVEALPVENGSGASNERHEQATQPKTNLCVFCGVHAEPKGMERHVQNHLTCDDVPSFELLKKVANVPDAHHAVVTYHDGCEPSLQQRDQKSGTRLTHKQLPLHYGDLTDTQNAWQQTSNCGNLQLSSDYHCVACKQGMTTNCRFENVRKFVEPFVGRSEPLRYVLASLHGEILANAVPNLPHASDEDKDFLRRRLVGPLAELIQIEENHEQHERILYRPANTMRTARCDSCACKIFSGHWCCYFCASLMCLDCFEQWNDSEKLENARFDFCTSRNGEAMRHRKSHMVPFTCFKEQHLDDLLCSMNDVTPYIAASVGIGRCFGTMQHEPWATAVCHEDVTKLNLPLFQRHWAVGEPLVLHDFHSLRSLWTPAGLSTACGSNESDVMQGNKIVERMTIKKFFDAFDEHRGLARDVPIYEHDRYKFAWLIDAFTELLPCPEYMTKHGKFNLDSWLPAKILPARPVLNLHGINIGPTGSLTISPVMLSMYDSFNCMTWAQSVDKKVGCATWDIFLPRNLSALRRYMLKFCDNKAADEDVFRVACRRLTDADLMELRQQHHVAPIRVYQKPGDAILIPAGCAYQLACSASHVSVSCSFITAENVNRFWTTLANEKRSNDMGHRERMFRMKQYILGTWMSITPSTAPAHDTLASAQADQNITGNKSVYVQALETSLMDFEMSDDERMGDDEEDENEPVSISTSVANLNEDREEAELEEQSQPSHGNETENAAMPSSSQVPSYGTQQQGSSSNPHVQEVGSTTKPSVSVSSSTTVLAATDSRRPNTGTQDNQAAVSLPRTAIPATKGHEHNGVTRPSLGRPHSNSTEVRRPSTMESIHKGVQESLDRLIDELDYE